MHIVCYLCRYSYLVVERGEYRLWGGNTFTKHTHKTSDVERVFECKSVMKAKYAAAWSELFTMFFFRIVIREIGSQRKKKSANENILRQAWWLTDHFYYMFFVFTIATRNLNQV